ncbi:MAG: ABC transporter substrate-binding protein [Oscillospiraceae bacterium]|nr:ABC transporter substrate-binding protein [Oscillospiraceae bacterium]
MKKFLAFLMATAMVVAMFAACGAQNEGGSASGEFVIGMSGPLTGGAAVYGVAVQNSAQMAIDEINAAGGLNGYKFKLVATDDQHDPTKVATNYATLLEKGVHVSLGTVTTKPGIEFKNLSKQDNLFFLTPSASGDDIPEFANGYQMCFADGDQGKVAAEYVNTLGLEKIGVFFKSDDPYSDGIYKNFVANLSTDITIVETQFTDANATDFAAQITQLKDCTFIFMPIYYQPAAIFMKQAKDTMAADAIYYGCDGFDGLAGEMDLSTISQEVSMLSHFDANSTEGKAAEFVKKYTEKFGTDTLNQFGASAYDCIYALYGAMQELIAEGKTVTPETSASDLCEMLKAKFNGGYSLAEGATGSNITWHESGKVNKIATKYTLKEAN